MVGIAIWHFAILVPDRFYAGILGAFVAAVIGALLAGYMLPTPGLPTASPPGVQESVWPVPGALLGSRWPTSAARTGSERQSRTPGDASSLGLACVPPATR